MERKGNFKTASKRVSIIVVIVIVGVAMLHYWDAVATLLWHFFGGDQSNECKYYQYCMSDQDFARSWTQPSILIKGLALIALAVVPATAWYSLIDPFIRGSKKTHVADEPVFCQNEFCECVERKGGVLAYPADFWDAQAGRWIIPSSSCVNPNCTCLDYHEGHEFNYTAGFWVRKDNT